jgi:hypothetical protein
MNAIWNAPNMKTSDFLFPPWNTVTSNQERILKPVCNKETSQKNMQMEKPEGYKWYMLNGSSNNRLLMY